MEKSLNREMGRMDARLLALTGLFAALGCVGTMVLQVPSPTGGYMNLGDAVVILGAWLLGPVYGAVAGGVGPAMADLLSGDADVPGPGEEGAASLRPGGGGPHGSGLLAV